MVPSRVSVRTPRPSACIRKCACACRVFDRDDHHRHNQRQAPGMAHAVEALQGAEDATRLTSVCAIGGKTTMILRVAQTPCPSHYTPLSQSFQSVIFQANKKLPILVSGVFFWRVFGGVFRLFLLRGGQLLLQLLLQALLLQLALSQARPRQPQLSLPSAFLPQLLRLHRECR